MAPNQEAVWRLHHSSSLSYRIHSIRQTTRRLLASVTSRQHESHPISKLSNQTCKESNHLHHAQEAYSPAVAVEAQKPRINQAQLPFWIESKTLQPLPRSTSKNDSLWSKIACTQSRLTFRLKINCWQCLSHALWARSKESHRLRPYLTRVSKVAVVLADTLQASLLLKSNSETCHLERTPQLYLIVVPNASHQP